MIAADLYEGIRTAEGRDASGVTALLRLLELEGFQPAFRPEDAALHLDNTVVIEREGQVRQGQRRSVLPLPPPMQRPAARPQATDPHLSPLPPHRCWAAPALWT